ncbi:MAG: aminotransferase class V-fold PLP-dependent enzyme [Phycisphaerales bacterium]|nr:aminotransferase class V-fold PLP-dependent enzyme [Phycisphaerales bacterium]
MLLNRRSFLSSSVGATTALAIGSLKDDWVRHVHAAHQQAGGRSPEELSADESFWFQIQQAFDLDRSLINLNNGGVSPSPRIVLDAMIRQLSFTNHAPSRHLWQVQDPRVELVRERLARTFGCSSEELAITRNASESLQIAINGIDLKPGDEFLTTSHDYPRMVNTLKQRMAREGIVLKQLRMPVPVESHDQLVRLFEESVTPRTRVILVCHIVNITGEIFPVKRICEMARRRGILTIVDGAHAFAHFAYTYDDIGCDFYGTSLHKWLTAPIGTGFLFVRKERIADLWPLTAADDPKSDNIRKFEEIGTHPTAPRLAIAEALTFHHGIGPERKEARLRRLRNYWAERLRRHDRVRIHTNLSSNHSCAIATVQIKGVDSEDLAVHLWNRHKIIVAAIAHEDFEGIRVTPNVYTTKRELDLFCDAMEQVVSEGLPSPSP